MSKKSSNKPKPQDGFDIPGVKSSAQQIWQAGLAVFNRAQTEGSKAFETLVQEGVELQRKAADMAGEKMTETTNKLSSMANELSGKASGQWGKLEGIFEERVAKALNKLGMPSARDIADLNARIDALHQALQTRSPAATKPAPRKKTVAKASAPAPVPAPVPTKATARASAKAATQAPARKATSPVAPAAPRAAVKRVRKAPARQTGSKVAAADKPE